MLLWNWQGNLSWFGGRRLKAASGVAYFNKTEAAERLLLAWAQAMAYPPNSDAPDDQALDLLVNNDGWIDRAAYGWLPAAYLRMSPHHSAVAPVIDHDRGVPSLAEGATRRRSPCCRRTRCPSRRPSTTASSDASCFRHFGAAGLETQCELGCKC